MKIDIMRAWKDKEYRNSLSNEELATLPENPAGVAELSETELNEVNGGIYYTYYCWTDSYRCRTAHSACC